MKAAGIGGENRRRKATDGWMDSEEEEIINNGERSVDEEEGGTTAWTRGIYTPNRIAAAGHMANTLSSAASAQLQRRGGGRRFKIANRSLIRF